MQIRIISNRSAVIKRDNIVSETWRRRNNKYRCGRRPRFGGDFASMQDRRATRMLLRGGMKMWHVDVAEEVVRGATSRVSPGFVRIP